MAAAAAHLLPPDFSYRTTLFATGPVRDGVLEGDLVIHGTGDPTISGRYEESMTAVWRGLADSLRVRGVREVAGGLVADASYWDDDLLHDDWENYDLLWWYAAPVGPIGFNDNSIDFRIRPGEVGGTARITWQPQTAYVQFRNEMVTVPPGEESDWDLRRVHGTDTVVAYGQIPADEGPSTEYFAVRDPALYAATVFREVLEEEGIGFGSREITTVSDPGGSPAAAAGPLVRYDSPGLPHIIGPILERSQNWFAEQLLKTLGREVGEQGSWEAGLSVVEEFLADSVGLDPETFELRDASGLSAGNLITPAALADLLFHLRHSPQGRLALEAMPASAAANGSLRSRFTDRPGRVRAKTGSIRNVQALSGYATTDAGGEVIFSILVNGSPVTSAELRRAIDDVVEIIAGG